MKLDKNKALIGFNKTLSSKHYTNVLKSIDEYLQKIEGDAYQKPNNIDEYKSALAKHNHKAFLLLLSVYDKLYICGIFHGTPSKVTIGGGILDAKALIELLK
ncbi:MAG: hypothetical protein RIQ33_91 [Bacteroidota bacterium]|jgi:hypothetical protein